MDTLIVQLPEKIREKLDARARTEGKDAQIIAAEILTRDLGAPDAQPVASAPLYETEKEKRERVYKKMREEGLIVPLSDELKKLIKDDVPSHEEVREILSRAGGKPLSQIVIEQRQERHDILVYGYQRARQMVRDRERKQSRPNASRRKRK